MEFSESLKSELRAYEECAGEVKLAYKEFISYLKRKTKRVHPDNSKGNEERAKELSHVLTEAQKEKKEELKLYFEEKNAQREKEREYKAYKKECEIKIKGRDGRGGSAGTRVKAAEGKEEPKGGIYNVIVTADLLEPKSYFMNEESGKTYYGSSFFYEYGQWCGSLSRYSDEGVLNQVIIKGEGEQAVKKIPRASFKECGLKELVIEKGVIEIEDGFCSCPEGTTRTCHQESKPNNEARKLCGAFCRCISLESVTLPEGLTKIGDRAFKYCWNLKKVTLGEGLKTIGKEAFMKTALEEIRLPISVNEIKEDAWKGCSKLKRIYVNNEEQKALIENVCEEQAEIFISPGISTEEPMEKEQLL